VLPAHASQHVVVGLAQLAHLQLLAHRQHHLAQLGVLGQHEGRDADEEAIRAAQHVHSKPLCLVLAAHWVVGGLVLEHALLHLSVHHKPASHTQPELRQHSGT